jgi:hypothetical protein
MGAFLMTDLTFQTPDEARAWDMYVAGALACPHLRDEGALEVADTLLLERRKRMAPPAQIVYSEQFS